MNRCLKPYALTAVAALALGALAYDWWGQRTPEATAPALRQPGALLPAAPAPDVPFVTLDGRRVAGWGDLPGPVVLVHFWASWCAPCLVELPKIIAFAERHPQVTLVLVSTDDSRAKAAGPTAGDGNNILRVWDEGKRLSLGFQALGVPETLVLDRRRLMVDKIVGEGPWDQTPAWLPR